MSQTIKSGRELIIASGGVYPELAEDVFAKLNQRGGVAASVGALSAKLIGTNRKTFPSGECYVRLDDSVREDDVYLMQTFFNAANDYSPNDALMELELLADAATRASASNITAVMPLFPYARQDRKAQGREPISAATVINNLVANGVGRILTVDLHSAQTQAVFKGPFDHLTAYYLLKDEIASRLTGEQSRSVIVSPDVGRLKENESLGEDLGLKVKLIPKDRRRENSQELIRPHKIKGVKGRVCYLVDDMIDTAGTLVSAADVLKRSGASSVIALATHGLFSANAISRIKDSRIDQVIVTDTVPQSEHQALLGDRLAVLSIADILAKAILEIHNGGSVSEMFGDRNNH